jgi:hypothetical protein
MFDLFFANDNFEWERDPTWEALEADFDVRDPDLLLDISVLIYGGEYLDALDVVVISGEFDYFSESVLDVVAIGFDDIIFTGYDSGFIDIQLHDFSVEIEDIIGNISEIDIDIYSYQDFIGFGSESLIIDIFYPEVEFIASKDLNSAIDIDVYDYMSTLIEGLIGSASLIDIEPIVFDSEFYSYIKLYLDFEIDAYEMSVDFQALNYLTGSIDIYAMEFIGEFYSYLSFLSNIDIIALDIDCNVYISLTRKYLNTILIHRRDYAL